MKKNVVVVSTSLRKNSNSAYLAKAFQKGAEEAGHCVEWIELTNKSIGFCKGCLVCQKTHQCVIDDDAREIAAALQKAEVIAFATPIYYYEMCGQLKTLLDRCNPLFASDYAFGDIYLLAAAADNDKSAMDGAVQGLQGWIDCFSKAKLAGVLRGIGLTDPKEAHNHPEILSEAYDLGKKL